MDFQKKQLDQIILQRTWFGGIAQILLALFVATFLLLGDKQQGNWLSYSLIFGIGLSAFFRMSAKILAERQSFKRWYPFAVRCHHIFVITGGLSWGVLAILAVKTFGPDSIETLMTVIIVSGIASAGAFTFSPRKKLALAFIASIMLPLAFGVPYFFKHQQGWVLGLAFATFIFFLTSQALAHSQLIAEHAQSTNKSREDNEITQKILDSVPGYLFWLDQNLTIKKSNANFSQFCHWFSPDQKAIGGQEWDKVALPLSLKLLVQNFVGGQSRFSDHQELALDLEGKIRWFLIVQTRLSLNLGFIVLMVDITSEKENQEKLHQIELERVRLAKTEDLALMAAGIGHEINNPLSIIRGRIDYLNFCLTQRGSIPPEELTKAIGLVQRTVDRISAIVRSLKRISRQTVGDPFIPENLSAIIHDTIELCRQRLDSYGILMKLNFSSTSELSVHCRPGEVSQVLYNLIGNSVDAICESKSPWIEISLQISPDWVRILVKDSGPGIPREIADKIMSPFFTTKAVGKGTGLGLSLAQRILRDHGGDLFLDPHHANTCFVMEFPPTLRTIKKSKRAA